MRGEGFVVAVIEDEEIMKVAPPSAKVSRSLHEASAENHHHARRCLVRRTDGALLPATASCGARPRARPSLVGPSTQFERDT